jgi:hypothetical protein
MKHMIVHADLIRIYNDTFQLNEKYFAIGIQFKGEHCNKSRSE